MPRGQRRLASPRTQELYEAKLAASGLDLRDAEALRFRALEPDAVAKLHPTFRPASSLLIPYHGPDGRPLADWPGAAPFFRVRYLEAPFGFVEAADGPPVRYVQAPQTAPVAYFPGNQAWGELALDADRPLIITEGELKAAAACKAGFPALGLGGVYNWRAYKLGLEWLPSLDLVTWAKRNVYVCFDSDLRTNSAVCVALRQLAEALQRRGAFPHLVTLPEALGPGVKVGLDDLLLLDDGARVLLDLLRVAEPLGLARPLWQFNDRYVYVRDPGLVVDVTTRARVSPAAFRDHLAAAETYVERSLRPDGQVAFKQVAAASAWLRWPLRREAARMTYAPGQATFTKANEYNTWRGWGCEPRRGDVGPFIALLDHLFTDAEPEARTWFLRWLAYPLRYPGTKLFSSAVLHGIRHGTGKSLIGYTLGKIYGANFTEIKQEDLHASFNQWAEAKQFVLADDVTGSNKRQDADLLKKLITQQTAWINTKFVPSYEIPDRINYLFTSNQPDAFFLEDDDRRYFIHEVTVPPLPEEFYVEYGLWLDGGGASALFAWLLAVDLGDFNPGAPALRTVARARMIADGQSDLATWVRRLLAEPDAVLRVGQVTIAHDLFTNRELLQLYDPHGRTGTTANGLGRELRRAGATQVLQGRPVRTPDGQDRFYALRDEARWRRAGAPEVLKHLAARAAASQPTKPKY